MYVDKYRVGSIIIPVIHFVLQDRPRQTDAAERRGAHPNLIPEERGQ